ncbi:YihY/virulence factor BrkB family protein [Pseudoxanthomonas winnipegensis]|uniref:YihY/virulence factor BrkB family protein n=1 Tax=Pseudoxanthomonas winnipegensis TaxID=2480810 RepID=A0A4Q8L6G9_9GAMM|nr:YihY/virulence factor BrkB family protein [Pseudoxanthomonas winnipegensis]PZP60087.1 MAG: BrkB protein [Pseudoxanthomonas spadix]TAA23336.1 YihY/virulence factor BrkB family protein [Pseudoxanthomonas winnipegensis]
MHLPSSDKLSRRLQKLQDSFPVALAKRFAESDLMTQAAALTFYALLSLAPLLVLLLWIVASLYPPAQDELLRQIAGLAGPQAGAVARTVLTNAKAQPSVGSLAGLWSTLLLFVGATAVFARLQAALNLIFYTDRTELTGGVWDFLKKRVFSFGVVLGLGFLLIVSMMAATALQVVLASVPSLLPVLGNALTFVLYAAAFGFLYHYLPDRPVEWRQALLGGVITAGLFIAGRYGIGLYLASTDPGSAYGTMGAMVIMLVWLYYATVVFFIGALLTAVIDERMDARAAHRAAEREAVLRQSSTERPAAVDPDAQALPAQELPSHRDGAPRA